MWMHSHVWDLFERMRGLRNYSLSCCVNTMLQSLAATHELSELLERWDAPGDASGVPLKLKAVLASMRSDRSTPAPHRSFLHCLHRNGLRLNTQHDANEVLLAVLDLVQQQMDDRALAAEIQSLYKTSVETQLQCLECGSIRTRRSFLLSVPLHLKEEHDTLEDCLVSFFQDQELRGADSWFCTPCGGKTPSRQAVQVLALPPVLCLQLKRFRSVGGRTNKLSCVVSFPQTFDFPRAALEAAPPDPCTYALYAVVVHSGSATCGHYTAFVRQREQWFYADDSHVQQSSWEEVQTSYGGSHSGTAYMLMYRRCPGDAQSLTDAK